MRSQQKGLLPKLFGGDQCSWKKSNQKFVPQQRWSLIVFGRQDRGCLWSLCLTCSHFWLVRMADHLKLHLAPAGQTGFAQHRLFTCQACSKSVLTAVSSNSPHGNWLWSFTAQTCLCLFFPLKLLHYQQCNNKICLDCSSSRFS